MRQILVVTVLALLSPSLSFGADGKQTFIDNNCNRCHAVASYDIEATLKSKNMLGPDLSNIGESRSAEWIDEYLQKEADIDGELHRVNFRGTDEQRQAIVEWLAQQKGS